MQVPDLAQSLQKVIEKFLSDFNILSVLVALNVVRVTAIFFSGMGGIYKAGHTFTSDSRR